jgi:hypothetical protein
MVYKQQKKKKKKNVCRVNFRSAKSSSLLLDRSLSFSLLIDSHCCCFDCLFRRLLARCLIARHFVAVFFGRLKLLLSSKNRCCLTAFFSLTGGQLTHNTYAIGSKDSVRFNNNIAILQSLGCCCAATACRRFLFLAFLARSVKDLRLFHSRAISLVDFIQYYYYRITIPFLCINLSRLCWHFSVFGFYFRSLFLFFLARAFSRQISKKQRSIANVRHCLFVVENSKSKSCRWN